jgi:hypothetical protein
MSLTVVHRTLTTVGSPGWLLVGLPPWLLVLLLEDDALSLGGTVARVPLLLVAGWVWGSGWPCLCFRSGCASWSGSAHCWEKVPVWGEKVAEAGFELGDLV